MLSNALRWLTYLTGFLYAVLGALLFVLPEQLAPVFAWKVSAFTTMFIGGWCLGNAWLAFGIARRWEWTSTYASLIYLWVFGVGQLFVLVGFISKVQVAHPIAWLYILVILLNALTAVLGVLDWMRVRPQLLPASIEINSLVVRIPLWGFILFLFYSASYGLLVSPGGFATMGEIFPEPLSAFTLRSVGVFFLAIALGAAQFIRNRDLEALLSHGYLSYGSIVIITLGEIIYFRAFNFAQFPLQVVFFLAYILVGIVVAIMFAKYGTGFPRK